MPPSTPVEAAPLSGIAAAGTQPAEAAASIHFNKPNSAAITHSHCSACTGEFSRCTSGGICCSQAAGSGHRHSIWSANCKASYIHSAVIAAGPSSASQSPPSAAALSSVAPVQPTAMPSPLLGLFQLPKLPIFGQQSQPEAQRPAEATPSDTPNPEALLDFTFPSCRRLGSFQTALLLGDSNCYSCPSKRQHTCRLMALPISWALQRRLT